HCVTRSAVANCGLIRRSKRFAGPGLGVAKTSATRRWPVALDKRDRAAILPVIQEYLQARRSVGQLLSRAGKSSVRNRSRLLSSLGTFPSVELRVKDYGRWFSLGDNPRNRLRRVFPGPAVGGFPAILPGSQ